jgi:hypothetical protein
MDPYKFRITSSIALKLKYPTNKKKRDLVTHHFDAMQPAQRLESCCRSTHDDHGATRDTQLWTPKKMIPVPENGLGTLQKEQP